MGSLHHIQVTGSDNEGTTIIILQINTICDCILILSTRVLPYLFAMERVLHPSTCQMPIKSLHTIPTVAQKAVNGAEGATTLIKALGKPTLTSAQAKRVDALGMKFEDLLNLYGEHHHGSFPYSLERSIASHCGRS